uniref:Uncharacterized protein n=1 Tax=Auxenochlorella protothecoides TaxID=3075 RepID=A0A1D1ZXY3_AUXPR
MRGPPTEAAALRRLLSHPARPFFPTLQPIQQVHLALATPGWDPRVHGSLRTLARRLTPVGIDASTSARQLLPLALGRQGAEGGSLAAAGPGVLLLDAGACSVRAGTSLMACLGAGDRLRVVADAPDLDLHATATLWLHLAATDFGRSCYDHTSPLELLARKYGRDAPLVFDVLVACPGPQAPAMAARLEDLLQAPDESERAAMTPDDLAQHMRVAQGLGQPRMTHEGLEALTAYFTCLRLGEEQAPQVGRPWHRRGWNLGACLHAPPPDPSTPIPTDGAAEPGTCGGCLCPSVPSCRDPAGARRRRGHRADGGASGSHGYAGHALGEVAGGLAGGRPAP